jgi:hypothetical protein
MEQKRICKRCLLSDIVPEEYLENMRIYIKGLDETIKTDDITYKDRLMICKECDQLNEGICRICGCFVEYRAAISRKSCPAVDPKW